MQRALSTLTDHTFDIVVVGGGISGACLAHDAALRGLEVALVDRGDFGAATSAASSKLLHGGVRYLQQLRFDRVLESLRERAIFQTLAPHLTRWVPFLIITHDTLLRGRRFLDLGLAVYRLLRLVGEPAVSSGAIPEPPGRFHDRSALARVAPELCTRTDVTGAHVIQECHLYSTERMTLAFLKTATQNGAQVANYVAVTGLLGDRTVQGVRATDLVTGTPLEIRARLVVNAAGPWLSALNGHLGLRALPRPVRGFSKGAHLITEQIFSDFAVALPTARQSNALLDRGGRHVFVIPWRGHSLIGTTDVPFTGSPDEARATLKDVDTLLEDVSRALPERPLTRRDVRHAFAGLYPLTAPRLEGDRYQGTGDYQVVDHAPRDGVEGVISVFGAKYTTARILAERATTLIGRKLRRQLPACQTPTTPVVGGDIDNLGHFTREAAARFSPTLDPRTIDYLVRSYGTEVDAVVEMGRDDPSLIRPLSPERESIGVEVAFAVEREMAVHLADVVFRRTGLGTLGFPGDACLEQCARIMRSRLHWSDGEEQEQIQRTKALFPLLHVGR